MELAALHDAKKPCADLAGASSGALAPQASVDAGAQAPQALEVSAPHAIDPLHHDHLLARQLRVHPWDLDLVR